MSLRDLNARHLRLISVYSSRHAIRGGTGLVFVLLTLIAGLLVAHSIITPVEQYKLQMEKRNVDVSEEEIVERLVDFGRPGVEFVLGGIHLDEDDPSYDEVKKEKERWASFLLEERPALLSAVLLLMIFMMPGISAVGAFNQFSGDVQSRGLRYQLLRTERANIFFGRYLGTAIFTALVVIFLITVITVYLGLKLDLYSWKDLIICSLHGVLALTVVILPYVALCTWISSAIDSPIASLVICMLILWAVPLFSLIGRNTWEPARHVIYLLPWGVQNHLLHPDGLNFLGSAAACLAYTAFFLTIGYWRFSKRDL